MLLQRRKRLHSSLPAHSSNCKFLLIKLYNTRYQSSPHRKVYTQLKCSRVLSQEKPSNYLHAASILWRMPKWHTSIMTSIMTYRFTPHPRLFHDTVVIQELPACQFKKHRRCQFDPWIKKFPWSRKWQHTPVFLTEKSHGQRSQTVWHDWATEHKRKENTF